MKKVLLALALAFVALSSVTVQAQTPTPKCGYRNKYPDGCLVPYVELNLRATQNVRTIFLQWNLIPNVETHYVWRYGAGGLKLLGGNEIGIFIDLPPECNRYYTYVIAPGRSHDLRYGQKVKILFRCDPPPGPRDENLPM